MNNEDLIKDDLMYDIESSSVGTSLNTTRAPSPVIVDEPLIQPKVGTSNFLHSNESIHLSKQPIVEAKIISANSNSPQTPGRTGRAKRPPKRFDD